MGQVLDSLVGGPQQRAAKSADKAYANQNEIFKKIVGLFDTKLGKIGSAEQGGLWNADKQIALADESLTRNEGLKRQQDAGAARTMGYRPGDTEPITKDRNTSQDFDLQRRMQSFGIRQQSMQNLLNAYNQINPSELQGAVQGYGQQGQMYQQQASAPNPLLQAATMYASGGGFGGGGGGFNMGGMANKPGSSIPRNK